jgi:hypothetical protein
VSSSLAFKLGIAGLLIFSLWLKAPGDESLAAPAQQQVATTQIAAFLTRQGFAPNAAPLEESPARVAGQSGSCRVLIAELAPQGWHQDIFRRFAAPEDRVFFIFQGRIHDAQPVWQTRFSFYWNRIVGHLGVNAAQNGLVYGVVATPECDLDAVPWLDLAETPPYEVG